MPWVRDFRASTVVSHAVGDASALQVRAISTAGIQANSEIRKELASALAYPDTVSLAGVRPVASFTTYDIPGAVTAFGLFKCFTSDETHPGVLFYSQNQGCAGAASGSVHDQYQIRQGVAVARNLTVDHRGNAQISYDIYAAWDGTNVPVARNTNVAMPSYGTIVGRWTMESMLLNSVAVEGKRNISVDFSPTVTQEGADSEVYDSVVKIASIMPRIVVRGVDTSWYTTHATIAGTTTTHATCIIDLLKRGIPAGTAQHCRLTAAGLVSWDNIFSGSPESPSECSFAIDAQYDGTNAPVLFTVNVSIA